MTKSACLILGSCLALQAPIALPDFNSDSLDASSLDSASLNSAVVLPLPLFHLEHSQELIDGGTDDHAQPAEMARFIYQKTRELLPVPFRGRSHLVAKALIETANEHQMDPLFLMAVIYQESQFNPNARGSHGEIGLMQLKPSTALVVASLKGLTDEQANSEVAAALLDPVQNIRLGAAYLARLRISFRHRSSLYISAYNMGAKGVRTHVASGKEPRIYSTSVLAHYVELSGGVARNVASTHAEFQIAGKTFGRTLDL